MGSTLGLTREPFQDLLYLGSQNVVAALLIAFSRDQASGATGEVLEVVPDAAGDAEPFLLDR